MPASSIGHRPAKLLAATSALLAAGCAGQPLTLAAPRPATVAAVETLAPHPCNATTAAALDALGVDPAQVTRIIYDRRTSGGEHSHLLGFDAYITRAGAPGLVVRLEPDCRLASWFQRGG